MITFFSVCQFRMQKECVNQISVFNVPIWILESDREEQNGFCVFWAPSVFFYLLPPPPLSLSPYLRRTLSGFYLFLLFALFRHYNLQLFPSFSLWLDVKLRLFIFNLGRWRDLKRIFPLFISFEMWFLFDIAFPKLSTIYPKFDITRVLLSLRIDASKNVDNFDWVWLFFNLLIMLRYFFRLSFVQLLTISILSHTQIRCDWLHATHIIRICSSFSKTFLIPNRC